MAEIVLKVILVGDVAVGKTSMVKRLVDNTFSTVHMATIGVDFLTKKMKVGGQQVTLRIWDIAGQERYGGMTRVYYNGAVGAVVVFDATRPKTLEGARQWKQGIDEKVSMPGRPGVKIPVLLLANKCDLGLDDMLEPLNLHRVIEEEGFLAWFATSAKDNIGITESFTFLVENILTTAAAPSAPVSSLPHSPRPSPSPPSSPDALDPPSSETVDISNPSKMARLQSTEGCC